MELNRLEKEVLLELPKPEYQELPNTYVHLKDLQITDHESKKRISSSCNTRHQRLHKNKNQSAT